MANEKITTAVGIADSVGGGIFASQVIPSWVTVTPVSGVGEGDLSIVVDPNTDFNTRRALLTITPEGGTPATVAIEQAGVNADNYVLKAGDTMTGPLSIDTAGDVAPLSVTSTKECPNLNAHMVGGLTAESIKSSISAIDKRAPIQFIGNAYILDGGRAEVFTYGDYGTLDATQDFDIAILIPQGMLTEADLTSGNLTIYLNCVANLPSSSTDTPRTVTLTLPICNSTIADSYFYWAMELKAGKYTGIVRTTPFMLHEIDAQNLPNGTFGLEFTLTFSSLPTSEWSLNVVNAQIIKLQ